MLNRLMQDRHRAIAAGVVAAIALLALLPGVWGTALAQTSSGDDQTATETPPASPEASPTATTTTAPDGTTTTTTTASDGTTTTETVSPNGDTVTVTERPDGHTTTVVDTSEGTVTVVQAPAQAIQVAVAPANVNTDSSLQVEALAMELDVPAGTLSPGEVIAIVEQSFALTIILASRMELDVTRAAYVASTVSLTTEGGLIVQEFATEPGTVSVVRAFELTVQKQDGTIGQIANPIQMTWDFAPENLAAAGGNFANLLMIGYDEGTGTWSPAEQVGQTATSVTFEVPHFSLWAFAVRSATAAQSVPTPADTGMGETSASTNTTAYLATAGMLALAAAMGVGARFAVRRTRA